MTDELKPCPFCGGTANIAKGQIEFWVYCPHCGARTEFYETEQEAADSWNARPIEDEKDKENKRLCEALAFYAHGKHLWDADERDPACDVYDLVSGQVENGKYAREVLEGGAE